MGFGSGLDIIKYHPSPSLNAVMRFDSFKFINYFFIWLLTKFVSVIILDKHIKDIGGLCSMHGVKHLYEFGLVLAENFNNNDVEVIVDF